MLLAFDAAGARPQRLPAHATSDQLLLALITERLQAHLDHATVAELAATLEYDVRIDDEHQPVPLQLVIETANPQPLLLTRADPALTGDARLMTSLARHLRGAFTLHALFTPEDAIDTLSWLHWGGTETDEDWLEEMRYMYGGDTEDDLEGLDAPALAERFGLTYPSGARRALRWAEEGPTVPLDALVAAHPPLAPLASVLAAPPEHPRWRELAFVDLHAARDADEAFEQFVEPEPTLVLFTGQHDSDEFLDELLQERNTYGMESGATVLPLALVRLPDLEPASVRAFLERLDALARLLSYENRILQALRDLQQGSARP
jgi:hypothetical protein